MHGQRRDPKGRRRRLGTVAVGAIAADHLQIKRLIFSQNSKRYPFPWKLFPHFLVKLLARTDFFFIDREYDVALLQTKFRGGSGRHDAADDDMPGHYLRIDAKPGAFWTAAHLPVLLQFLFVLPIVVNRNRQRELSNFA